MTAYVVMAGPPALTFAWIGSSDAEVGSAVGAPSYWYLLSINAGVATRLGSFDDERVARRVADLLSRHGTVDVPLNEMTP